MTGHESKEWKSTGFLISTDKALLQFDRIHRFLSEEAYWCLDIPRTIVEKAAEKSLCFGVYAINGNCTDQIGYARVVTDDATFAWLCDVYIEKDHRGKGLSKWLMTCVMETLRDMKLRRICLATKDAHSLYKKFDFIVTATPGNWMEIKDNDLYKKLKEQSQLGTVDHFK